MVTFHDQPAVGGPHRRLDQSIDRDHTCDDHLAHAVLLMWHKAVSACPDMPRDLGERVEYRSQYVGSHSELGGAGALSVLLVRRGGGKTGFDFRSHERPLRFDIEHPPFHLGGTHTDHPTRYVLTDLGLEVLARSYRLGIVQRCQRTPQCGHSGTIVFPHSRAELPSQGDFAGRQIPSGRW
jgi:hypothetical protein